MAGASCQQTAAVLRLQSDLRAIKTEPPDGCSASPHSDDNLFVWSATIFGPDETAWEGGVFSLRMIRQTAGSAELAHTACGPKPSQQSERIDERGVARPG